MGAEQLLVDSSSLPEVLLVGVFVLAGWLAHRLGQFTHVPRVTILLLIGVVAGPNLMDVMPAEAARWFPLVTQFSMSMVGFLLGESFAGREIRHSGKVVLWVSIGETLGAAVLVFLVIWWLQGELLMALLLAGIAPASAPAATLDVVREGHARGPLTRTVLGVVAIDDAWGVMLFSCLLVVVEVLSGQGQWWSDIAHGLWDVFGALLLGVAMGIPMAYVTGRMPKGEPTLMEAAGFVFLCAGMAMLLEVSYLLACITLGATVANRARHHTRPFREIQGASEPFLVMFFLLAGYQCELQALTVLGGLGAAYIAARSIGLIVGGSVAASQAGATPVVAQRIGWCLLPQAGVALGLVLLVVERFPALGARILPLVLATTVVFELVGPPVTRWHLRRAGEL